jgi:Mn-dependent DtxR family transcriptional regulator
MVSASVVRDLLRDGDLQPQAIATRLGDQVSYQDVLPALTELSQAGLAQPTSGGKWGLTDAGRRRS